MEAYRKINKTIIIISLFCSLYSIAQGDYNFTKKLNFKNFSTKDGLSQRSVIGIAQDNQGFMWFGTRYGLNKFDGNIFKTYNYNSEDENSLSNNWVTALTKDYEGTLWIGTKNGLNKYDKKNDSFIKINKTGLAEQSNENEIWDIEVLDSTFLWIASNNGLKKFNTKTQGILNFKHNKNNPNSISSNEIRELLVTKKGDLWICTTEKIDVYNQKNNTFIQYEYPGKASPKITITKNNTITLFQDHNQNIWLGYSGGLAIFNNKTNAFEDFKLIEKSNNTITSEVRSICEDNENSMWVGTYDGLYRLDIENKIVNKYIHDVTEPNSLSQNSIYNILQDSRGDLWIGTWAGGINYLDKSSNVFLSFSEGSNNTSLNYKVVSSIVEDIDDNLWIGTEGGGINFYNKENGTFTYYTYNSNDDNSLSANNVKAIIKDHTGAFWIGTHDKGINQLIISGSKKTFKRFKNNLKANVSLSDNKITALAEDDYYNIWIGTNEGGLNFYNRTTKAFTRIDDSDKILGNFIYTIIKSKISNVLFIGSRNGLAKIKAKTKDIQPISFRKKTKNTFTVNQITSIYEESATSLWIGTEGDGLYNYNTTTGQSIRYGLANGLPNEVIYGILPDDNNNIWLSTNKGLSRLNLETNKFKNFEETDGLQGNEFNYGAYLKSKNGNLIFGGTNGFTIFNPNSIKEDKFIPPIVITAFNVRNKPFSVITDSTKTITLKYNQNDFSFNFVALSYSQPSKNQYAYKLEGFDTDWNYIGNNKTAVYTNLNYGDYQFKVNASNSDGVWNEIPQSINLKIRPPIWKTWWAYLIYTLFSATLIWLIRRYTLLRIQDRNELKQERLDKEQMEEVNRLKLQLFTNISHDFRTPLTLIIGPLKRLIDDKNNNKPFQKQLSGMYRNASILLQLINQLLDFRKSEAGKLNLQATKNDMVAFLENIQLCFEELAKERNIKYTLNSTGKSIGVWFDKIEMKKVILNILSNAFKFTPTNGEVSLKISNYKKNKEPNNQYVKIEIKDSGKGIPKEDIDFVFDRYFQLGQQNELRSGTGVGLALAKDIVELHHGQIYVESKQGGGSCFTILLPLGNSHLKPEEIIDTDYASDDSLGYYEIANVKSGWVREEVNRVPANINASLPSILLVEDNIELRRFIKEIFEKDFNIFEAENGREGINSAQYNPIDVIVSDIKMPEMDGIQMCHIIKSDIRTSHIPVILLTARTSSKIQKIGYKTGADAYLTKPFDAATLKLQVLNILKSRQHLIDKFKKDILLEPKEITVVSTDEIFLKNAMEIIEDNITNSDFNVNCFTNKMNMSQSVLYRKIKVLTGHSISEFIRAVRLKRASQLLYQTNMSITEVAYDIGFSDIKYFRKCFKKTFNETPSQYRKARLISN